MWEENVPMRKDIEFKTEDGIKLRGWHYLPEKTNRQGAYHCHGSRLLRREGNVS